MAAGPSWQDHGLIFPSEVGTPLDPDNCEGALSVTIGLETAPGPSASATKPKSWLNVGPDPSAMSGGKSLTVG